MAMLVAQGLLCWALFRELHLKEMVLTLQWLCRAVLSVTGLMPPALWTHRFGIWKGKCRLPSPPFCLHGAAFSNLETRNEIYTWQVAGP